MRRLAIVNGDCTGRRQSPSSTTRATPSGLCCTNAIAEHFETWYALASAGQFDGQGDHHTPKSYVRQAFRKYLECGIFAHGFARAFIHRFGSSLNGHVHFHVCVVDGVFDEVAGETDAQSSSPGIVFHPAGA